MLTLHLSRIPDQAADALHQAAVRAYQSGRKVNLVVPNQYTVEAEQALMDVLGKDVLFDLQVKTFSALEKEIFLRGQGYLRPVLSDLGRRMILRLLLESTQEEWTVFRKEVRGKSFLSLLSDQLSEFREYGLNPNELIKMGELAGGSTQRKLEETAHLIRLYDDRISGRFEDANGRMERAFSQQEALLSYQDTDFFFDYFHSLSEIEMAALGALLEVTDVELSMVLDPQIGRRLAQKDPKAPIEQVMADLDSVVPDASAFSLSIRFFNHLFEEARLRKVPVRILEANNQVKTHPVFLHASKNLFSYLPQKKMFQDPPLYAYFCRNTQEEVDKAIVEMNRLIHQGARYRDFQLIYMDDDQYPPILKKRFDEEKLPYFMDEARSVQYHPLVQAIESALEIVGLGPRKDRYFRFLKSGMLNLEQEEIEIYQKQVVALQLDEERLNDDRYFTFDEKILKTYPKDGLQWKEERERAKTVKQTLENALAPLFALSKRKESLASYSKALVTLLLEKNIQDSLRSYEKKLLDQGKREEWESHRQLWDQLMDLFDELVRFAGEEEVSFAVFAKIIEEGLENLKLGIIPPYQDQILCSGLLRTRARTRPYVFMLGLNAPYLPKGRKEAGLFSQEEKIFFQRQGFFLPSMAQVQEEEERLNFYSAVLKVGKELRLFSSRQNVSNEPMEPSFWLQRLLDVILLGEGQPMKGEEVLAFTKEDQLYSTSLRELVWPEKIRQGLRMKTSLIPEVQWLTLLKERKRGEEEPILQALHLDHERPLLSPLVCELLFKKERTISATTLETFGACPYRAFAQNILRPVEEKTFSLSPMDTGILFHQALHLWSAHIQECLLKGKAILYPESQAALEKALDDREKALFEKINREDPRNAFFLTLAEKTLSENHQQTFFQLINAQMLFLYHELTFGPGRKIGPYPLTFSETGEKFYLEGTVDRIDFLFSEKQEDDHENKPPMIRVIDYKTGKKTFDFTRLLAGLDLQLPLYLQAVSSMGKPIGFFYMPVRPLDKAEEKDEKGLLPLAGEALLDGLLLQDEKAVRASDFTYSWDGARPKTSLIYKIGPKQNPEKNTADGRISKEKAGPLDRENILKGEDFQLLLEKVSFIAGDFAGRRSRGEISPRPFRTNAQRACTFCPYSSLCRFESRNQFTKYRMIEPIRPRDWKKAQFDQKEVDDHEVFGRTEKSPGNSK